MIIVMTSVIARPVSIKFVADFIILGLVKTIILSKLKVIPNMQQNAESQP
jgi:hypothetical protein